MGLTIEQMKLSPVAEAAAQLVIAAHPDVLFTSGQRSLQTQGLVMAQNAIRHGAAWLRDTYKNQLMVSCLMTYMEENRELCSNPSALGKGFYEQLQEHFGDYFLTFPHVRGDAFDIAWPRLKNGLIDRTKGEQVCKTIEKIPTLDLLLRKEGTLDVIHAQFKNSEV